MMRPIDLGLIQARRKKIADELAGHRQAIAMLEGEARELEIAERVFARLTGTGVPDLHRSVSNATLLGGGLPSGKPEGTPTVPDMIREALRHALGLGAQGLPPAGLLSYVQGKYWPTAQPNDVGPTAWRMVQRGELVRDGALYCLPPDRREVAA